MKNWLKKNRKNLFKLIGILGIYGITFILEKVYGMEFFCLSYLPFVFIGGVDFNGDADYIEGSTLPAPNNNQLTISAWVKRGTTTSRIIIVYGRNNSSYIFAVGMDGSDKFKLTKYGVVDIFTGDYPNDTNWHHVLALYGDNGSDVYVDGVLNGDTTNTSNFNAPTQNFLISYSNSDGPGYCNQRITELAIWNTTLSSDQIALLYSSRLKRMPLQIQPSHLKLYLPLDDHPDGTGINGKTYKDASGNGNDGTGVDADGDSTNKAEEVLSYP